MYNNKRSISSPDAAILCLMPATSHPKAVAGMCYAIIKAHTSICYAKIKIHTDRVKSIKSSSTNWGLGYKIAWVIDMLSQHAMHNKAIPACNQPIGSQGSQTHYPSLQ